MLHFHLHIFPRPCLSFEHLTLLLLLLVDSTLADTILSKYILLYQIFAQLITCYIYMHLHDY